MLHGLATARAVIASAACIVTITGLTACSTTNSESASGSTTITISSWYEDEIIQPALDAANEELAAEGIELEHTFIQLDQYNNWLSTQLASGQGPDIIVDGANFPARISAENLQPVEDEELLASYKSAGLALATGRDGEVYGVPSYGWFSGYFFNKDIFEQYDVKVPTTFDELRDVSKTFADNGVIPIAMGLAEGNDRAWHSLNGFLENAFYNNGAGSPEVDTEFAYGETTLKGHWDEPVERWSTLISDGILNPQMLGIAESQALSDFTSGKAAMLISGPWDYSKFSDAGMNFGMFPHVGDDASDPWLIGGPAANFGINAQSEHTEEAALALAALGSQAAQQAFVDASPGSFSYHQGVSANLPAEYELVAPSLENGNVGVPADRWGVNMPSQSMIDTGIKELQKLIGGDTTAQEFVDAMDEQANAIRY